MLFAQALIGRLLFAQALIGYLLFAQALIDGCLLFAQALIAEHGIRSGYRRALHNHREAGGLMVKLHVERTIAASPERVFDWLADPANLTAAPLALKAGFARGSSEPRVGALREVTGVGLWFREEITAYDAPRTYSYRIVRSFPAFDHEGGTLTFSPSGDGTHVDWVTTYTHPARAGGKAMEAVSSRLLRWSFLAILDGCAKALEGSYTPLQ